MHSCRIRAELSRHVFWKGNHHVQSTRRAPAISLGMLRVCSDCSLRRLDLGECPAGQKAPGQSAGRCFGCHNHSGRRAQRQEQSSGPLGLGAQALFRNMPAAGAHESQCTLNLVSAPSWLQECSSYAHSIISSSHISCKKQQDDS